ncbi:MAG: class I SAM-dependent methyltransferase [Actinobacteria bacterium]|nr:class I SAM-dependent methyltransferase [Actinomycetota bacterium]
MAPAVYPAAWILKNVRARGVERLPRCRSALLRIGVFPIRDHYYEPQFDMRSARRPWAQARPLPGIDWNVDEQIGLLESMCFASELADTPFDKPEHLGFYLDNGSFESGDAEYWYQMVRLKKPRRIFEIGSGNSTLAAIQAIRANQVEDPEYTCKHVCVEPYEMPWLEETAVSVVRGKVEDLDVAFFSELQESDVLFIDSSHIIRPDGDVLFEYLELLPTLNKGVIVHVHDIFSPWNYPEEWLAERVLFWNEQYLLEALLSHNSSWAIVGALNYLRHYHYEKLKAVAPFLTPEREPGSFYIQKRT